MPGTRTDPSSNFTQLDRRGWLSRRRIILIGSGLLALQLAVLGFLVAGSLGFVKRYGPDTVSFVAAYAAGQLADKGAAPLVYDDVTLGETEVTVAHPGVHFNAFPYPPIYLLACAPLALIPFLMAFGLFETTTLALYLVAVKKILLANGWSWVVPALAFPATFWTIGYGQNSFITAALFGAGTLLVDQRPALAGAVLGMLCFKPQFAVLVPVALVAARRWTAVAGAVVSVAILIGLSAVFFDWETWRAFLRATLSSGMLARFNTSSTNVFGSASPFAGALVLGLSYPQARIAQLAATVLMVVFVAWIWRGNASLPVRSAALAAGTLVAVPYALLYDLLLAGIAGAWLIRAGHETGFTRWDKPVLAAVYILPLFALQAGMALHLPLTPLAGVGLVGLCAARAWRERDLGGRSAA